jgi:hypothetical protein
LLIVEFDIPPTIRTYRAHYGIDEIDPIQTSVQVTRLGFGR